MDEANVVQVDFVARERAAPLVPLDMNPSTEALDIAFIGENFDYVAETSEVARAIRTVLFEGTGFSPHDEVFALPAGLHLEAKELCERIHDSGKDQWEDNPWHFGALVLEFERRIERAMSQFLYHGA